MAFLQKYFSFAVLPVLLLALGIASLLIPHLQISWFAFVTDIIVSMVLSLAFALALQWSVNAYPVRMLSLVHAMIMSLSMAGIIYGLEGIILKILIFKEDTVYVRTFEQTDHLRFLLLWFCQGWTANVSVARKQYKDLKQEVELQRSNELILKETELFKLRQQLQPHFLYNSLNSINALVLIQPEKAQAMVGKLSDFLRLSVKRESQESIPLEDELSYIESYLAIESIRFGDRLNVIVERSFDATQHLFIPPFVLQPVLENAIKFGLYGNTGNVTIDIRLEWQQNLLVISVKNPYDITAQPPKGTGFGLEGIRRRLYLLFARADLVETRQANNMFTTILKIPQHV